jgi:hypothetical protein
LAYQEEIGTLLSQSLLGEDVAGVDDDLEALMQEVSSGGDGISQANATHGGRPSKCGGDVGVLVTVCYCIVLLFLKYLGSFFGKVFS